MLSESTSAFFFCQPVSAFTGPTCSTSWSRRGGDQVLSGDVSGVDQVSSRQG
ncbi:MAG: hypothetical protein J2P17_29445 [Mycobacterium sp.]|nr:hypothetical protein [Mycobacterium sp.]